MGSATQRIAAPGTATASANATALQTPTEKARVGKPRTHDLVPYLLRAPSIRDDVGAAQHVPLVPSLVPMHACPRLLVRDERLARSHCRLVTNLTHGLPFGFEVLGQAPRHHCLVAVLKVLAKVIQAQGAQEKRLNLNLTRREVCAKRLRTTIRNGYASPSVRRPKRSLAHATVRVIIGGGSHRIKEVQALRGQRKRPAAQLPPLTQIAIHEAYGHVTRPRHEPRRPTIAQPRIRIELLALRLRPLWLRESCIAQELLRPSEQEAVGRPLSPNATSGASSPCSHIGSHFPALPFRRSSLSRASTSSSNSSPARSTRSRPSARSH